MRRLRIRQILAAVILVASFAGGAALILFRRLDLVSAASLNPGACIHIPIRQPDVCLVYGHPFKVLGIALMMVGVFLAWLTWPGLTPPVGPEAHGQRPSDRAILRT
jgi:hypothetical protein